MLFKNLAEGNLLLDDETVRDEEFVNFFMATSKAVVHTRRHEKIVLFARLLESVFVGEEEYSFDEYEELLCILEELSYREILALHILDQYSHRPKSNKQNEVEWCNTFWDEFTKELCGKVRLQPQEVRSFLVRIARTGCYEVHVGAIWDYKGDRGQLTPIYHRLKLLPRVQAQLEKEYTNLTSN